MNTSYSQLKMPTILAAVWLILSLPSWAGGSAGPNNPIVPQPTEHEMLGRIHELKQSPPQVTPRNNASRKFRLGQELCCLGSLYNHTKRYIDADRTYDEALAVLSSCQSAECIGYLRYWADIVAKQYMTRGEFQKAKKYIDVELQVCQRNSHVFSRNPAIEPSGEGSYTC